MLSDLQMANMQAIQERSMADTCTIQRYQSSDDDYGNPKAAWPDGWSVLCGLKHVDPDEVQGAGNVPIIDARLRLSLDYVDMIDERDRIKITHRYGTALETPQVFSIVGPVKRGPTGIVLELKIVTDGSEVGA